MVRRRFCEVGLLALLQALLPAPASAPLAASLCRLAANLLASPGVPLLSAKKEAWGAGLAGALVATFEAHCSVDAVLRERGGSSGRSSSSARSAGHFSPSVAHHASLALRSLAVVADISDCSFSAVSADKARKAQLAPVLALARRASEVGCSGDWAVRALVTTLAHIGVR